MFIMSSLKTSFLHMFKPSQAHVYTYAHEHMHSHVNVLLWVHTGTQRGPDFIRPHTLPFPPSELYLAVLPGTMVQFAITWTHPVSTLVSAIPVLFPRFWHTTQVFLLGASTDYRVPMRCFLSCLCQPEFNMYPGLCSLLGLLYSQSCEGES